MIWLLAALAHGGPLADELDSRWQAAREDATWRSPTVAERRAVRGALWTLAAGTCAEEELRGVEAELRAVDLRLDVLHHEEARVVVVWEGGGAHRGAGLYAVRCGPAAPLVWQAPHPQYEPGSRPLTRLLFEESGARALVWSTSHRYRSHPEEHPDDPIHPADVTREHGSLFQAATAGLAAASPELRFVQVHGFDRGQDFGWAAVVSHGDRAPAAGLADLLTPVLGATAAWGRDTSVLGGTLNVQGRLLSQEEGPPRFLHLELSPSARQHLNRTPASRAALVEIVGGPW